MFEWVWEPDDFAVLWYSDANDRFPSPIAYTSRFPTNDEVAAHRAAVRGRYDAEQTERIQLAFHTLSASDLRVEILGESKTFGRGTPREYRVVGARTPQYAVMLTQSAADGVHGRIRCRLFPTEQLAPRLAHVLPACPPGTSKPDTFHLAELRRRPDDHHRNHDRERYDRLARRPLDGGGGAILVAGYLHGDAEPWQAAQWVDLTDDGRYLQLRTREHFTVRPVAPADLTTMFTTWFDHALRRLREDEPDTW